MLPEPNLFESARAVKPVDYRPIEGFPGYRVGSDGTIWTCWKYGGALPPYTSDEWRQKKVQEDSNGYYAVRLSRNRKERPYRVHLIVIQAFSGPKPSPKMETRHLDGNRLNNAVENLRWGTRAENSADQVKHGTQVRGERNAKSKLTETIVRYIRRRGDVSYRRMGKMLGVGASTVQAVREFKTWKHVI